MSHKLSSIMVYSKTVPLLTFNTYIS
uniref:Uncharacterized protein n=1 Tax=Anguilla anguilla TaxID=7936 RepID=A0A0E9VR74_ANGAN